MTKITFLALLSLALVATPGCQPSSPTDSAATSASESGDDHGHDDHDHGDHEGHDHEGHDHDAHGHEGHDHGDHEVIDADAAGLSSDALVHLEKPDAPKSFAAAVEKLSKMKATIASGFADDDVDSIHNELHDIGTLLEQTEALAKSSDLNEEQKKQALAAVDALFDAFGSVDAKLHGENGAEYSEVSGDIDDSIKVLGGLQ
ncbi:putative transmembrane region and signal peptide protein [Rhodopirellula islandica]|uniref:Transmembrane region and signal peptide protein n=1 Tax=Rhodopirellula islandica TaxID=595434 RepID=A0A0J1BFW8_RHOIS|nr:hypothetical protein [Rhodopirellula islandica]KLU05435.1 putative transmembrane region and signal peptide protein [Rhodopirellula islandica]